jgi:hypothetical protein
VGAASFTSTKCAEKGSTFVYSAVDNTEVWLDHTEESDNLPAECGASLSENIFEDKPGAFYAIWRNQFQRCSWLKRQFADYIKAGNEAWVQRPFSCHSCTYELDNNVQLETIKTPELNEPSSQTAFISIFLLTYLLCCFYFCEWAYFRRCQICKKNNDQGKGLVYEQEGCWWMP